MRFPETREFALPTQRWSWPVLLFSFAATIFFGGCPDGKRDGAESPVGSDAARVDVAKFQSGRRTNANTHDGATSGTLRQKPRPPLSKRAQIGAPYPGLAPAEAPDASVDSRPRVGVRATKRPVLPEKPAEPAQLRVTTLHAGESVVADLFVNDKKVDTTPALLNLPAGSYRLSVRRKGYAAKTWTIQLRPGQKRRELVEMER